MQKDLDVYLTHYNTKRPHQGRGMNGSTPQKAFNNGLKKRPKDEKKNVGLFASGIEQYFYQFHYTD
jgi:hypothetical protein